MIVEPMRGMRLYGSYAEGYTVPDVGRILREVERLNRMVTALLDYGRPDAARLAPGVVVGPVTTRPAPSAIARRSAASASAINMSATRGVSATATPMLRSWPALPGARC